jgi:hypothetical protein
MFKILNDNEGLKNMTDRINSTIDDLMSVLLTINHVDEIESSNITNAISHALRNCILCSM